MQSLEAKFKLASLERTRQQAEALGYEFKTTLRQRDSFFRVANGRLKLREQTDGAALIHYAREHRGALELSNYEILPVADPGRMRAIVGAALGVLAEVKKERTVLVCGNLRLHLDRVDGLGDFGEIEAVLEPGADEAQSERAVDDLLAVLGVRRSGLIRVSYFEMLRPVS